MHICNSEIAFGAFSLVNLSNEPPKRYNDTGLWFIKMTVLTSKRNTAFVVLVVYIFMDITWRLSETKCIQKTYNMAITAKYGELNVM